MSGDCERCSWSPEAHEPAVRRWWLALGVVPEQDAPCRRYEPPAPWWLRALASVTVALSRGSA